MKNRKWLMGWIGIVLGISVLLPGCDVATQQNRERWDTAERLMNQTPIPKLTRSVERENILKRLQVSNDPTTLQWIFLLSNGRVLARLPVMGKVTSGGKRLTASKTFDDEEAPDESGAYGSGGEYIFWFDPNGMIHQFKGDYFVSPVPYQIEKGYGTIRYEIDTVEQSNASKYKQQIQKQQ